LMQFRSLSGRDLHTELGFVWCSSGPRSHRKDRVGEGRVRGGDTGRRWGRSPSASSGTQTIGRVMPQLRRARGRPLAECR
jgi:hypothetical protein